MGWNLLSIRRCYFDSLDVLVDVTFEFEFFHIRQEEVTEFLEIEEFIFEIFEIH